MSDVPHAEHWRSVHMLPIPHFGHVFMPSVETAYGDSTAAERRLLRAFRLERLIRMAAIASAADGDEEDEQQRVHCHAPLRRTHDAPAIVLVPPAGPVAERTRTIRRCHPGRFGHGRRRRGAALLAWPP